MNARNRGVVTRLAGKIDAFTSGKIEFDEMQSQLQVALIRFTMLLDEQRSAAVFRLDGLRETLAAESGDATGLDGRQ